MLRILIIKLTYEKIFYKFNLFHKTSYIQDTSKIGQNTD